MEGMPVTHPHARPRRRQGDRRPGRPRECQPGARPARDPLLPRRAADLPHPAARDPARLALRQGAGSCCRCSSHVARDRAVARRASGRRSSSSTSESITFDEYVPVGGMIEVPAAALALPMFMRQARLPLDRHQRPHPVHARDRPRRRRGGAPLRPAAPGGAEPHRGRDPHRAAATSSRSRCAARWRATSSSRACCSASACATSRCTRRSCSPSRSACCAPISPRRSRSRSACCASRSGEDRELLANLNS